MAELNSKNSRGAAFPGVLNGVRPSSGAERSETQTASRKSDDATPRQFAAPEDGRTPPNTCAFLQSRLVLLLTLLFVGRGLAVVSIIEHDVRHKRIIFSDAKHNLILRLNYDSKCVLDQVSALGRQVIREDTGVCSAIKVGDQWFTTRTGIPTPKVAVISNSVTITGIDFGAADMKVSETWRFTVHSDHIAWRIERSYLH